MTEPTKEFIDQWIADHTEKYGPLFYTLDADHNLVPTNDVMVWARFFENFENRKVALTQVGPYAISTVFLGTHSGFGHFELFESMAFDGNSEKPYRDLRQWCYGTWAEAEAGHARMVKLFERFWRKKRQ